MDTFISYEGKPINAGGAHSLGNKAADQIYLDTSKFLKNFTNSSCIQHLTLTFYVSQDKSYPTWPILWKLIKKFGLPSYRSWDLIDAKQHFFTWKLHVGRLNDGLAIIKQYKDLPKNDYGPLVLSILWHFHFVDPGNHKPFEGQDMIPILDFRQLNSQLNLKLGQKSTASCWFAFPFNEIGETESKYFKLLSANLPFKPSDKYWRIWRHSKQGKWNPHKIQIGLPGTAAD